MKLQSVLVASMVVAGLSFASASAHASPILDVGICLDRDGSCAQATSCSTNADCSLSLLNLGKVCDTVAHKCVTSCVGDLLGGILGTNKCQDGTAPICGVAGAGLCGCNDDTQCGTGKTCSTLLHRCVAPVSLPDAGISFPTLPNLPVDGGMLPTIPSAPGSSSGGAAPDGTDGSGGGGSSSGNGATPDSAGASAAVSAGASVGDAGLDADVALAADGGCSTGGHGSGVTFLGVLGAAFAFAAARRRRQH